MRISDWSSDVCSSDLSGELMLTKAQLQGPEADAALAAADIQGAVIRGATQAYGDKGIRLLSEGAWVRVRNMLEDDPSLLGTTTTMWLSAESNLDLIAKGKMPESAAPEAAAPYQRLTNGRSNVLPPFT